jgi:N-carbamoylputrescine amidase
MAPAKIKIGLVQARCTADKPANLRKAEEKVREAADKGAQIICLQELFSTLYFCQSETHDFFDLAEPLPGPSVEALSAVAREKSVVIIAPVFEKRAEGIYHNSAAVIDADGTVLGLYRKMHIPDDPNFYEKFYFTPGDLGFKSFQTRYGKIGVLICWDQWFPEAARLTALTGAQILFYPTAIGWHQNDAALAKDQHSAWQTIQRGHAVANEVFVAAANRVGKEGDLTFWGKSFVSDPFGKVIAEASESDEEILIVECDLGRIEETRRYWPFLRDRRVDAYGGITSRFLD